MSSWRSSRTRALLAGTSAAVLVIGLAAGADARVVDEAKLTPRSQFVMAPDGSSGTTSQGAALPNIDSVRSTIRTYYNATNGIADKENSPYITEMKNLADAQWGYLVNAYYDAIDAGEQPAIVFDADDTTLWSYDMEDGDMKFNFDPVLQNEWIQDQRFPATPGMVNLVNRAARIGFAIFGITGRKDTQKDATVANLAKVGYTPFTADNFYTKFATGEQPSYITCAAVKCTTVEYKAQTRQHIESLGYDVVLNVGDQWSDLQGGFADKALKVPNPTYYLPSPNLSGVDEPELAPRTEFTMAPDGSSGMTEGGEGIPNMDSVKLTLRTYYGAVDGIADKETSPYITELTRFSDKWTPKMSGICARQKAKGHRPVAIFDADDTTLWTYDMQDAAMGFNYDPAVQNVWIQEQRYVPTPKMLSVVRAARQGGCKIAGITGRKDDQRTATIANLNTYYDDAFRSKFYFTKWTGVDDSQQPSYITCAEVKCTTIEYKSQTRQHVEDMGYKVVANFGDQFSDLKGGYAARALKLPNATYYLP